MAEHYGGKEAWRRSTLLQEALVHLASQHSWAWFGTVTFRRACRPTAAGRLFFAFLAAMPSLSRPTDVLWGTEGSSRSGRIHLHFLAKRAAISWTYRQWKERLGDHLGWSRVYPYDVARGAAWYVTKYVLKETAGADAEWGWWGHEDLLDSVDKGIVVAPRNPSAPHRYPRASDSEAQTHQELDAEEDAQLWIESAEEVARQIAEARRQGSLR